MTEHRIEFRQSENPWAPTAVIEEIIECTNSGLVLVGLDEQIGGTSGAAYVRWPNGRDAVLTRTTTPLDRMQQTAEVLAMARSKGLPVPRHDLILPLADGYLAVVQERLPGRPSRHIDIHVVETMVAANERFAGLLADRSEVPVVGPTAGSDLVHTDYIPDNVLYDENGRVTGIVDWNFGVARGDRHFALIKLRNDLDNRANVEPEAIQRLDEILRRISSDRSSSRASSSP